MGSAERYLPHPSIFFTSDSLNCLSAAVKHFKRPQLHRDLEQTRCLSVYWIIIRGRIGRCQKDAYTWWIAGVNEKSFLYRWIPSFRQHCTDPQASMSSTETPFSHATHIQLCPQVFGQRLSSYNFASIQNHMGFEIQQSRCGQTTDFQL